MAHHHLLFLITEATNQRTQRVIRRANIQERGAGTSKCIFNSFTQLMKGNFSKKADNLHCSHNFYQSNNNWCVLTKLLRHRSENNLLPLQRRCISYILYKLQSDKRKQPIIWLILKNPISLKWLFLFNFFEFLPELLVTEYFTNWGDRVW